MIKQNLVQEHRPKVPSIGELVKWHNQFGRMLEPNGKRTKLFGVDGKEVKILERSRPEHFYVNDRNDNPEDFMDAAGDCHIIRTNGSEGTFRLDLSDGRRGYLTYHECDLVLGSNYYLIDKSYHSPSALIRAILFKAEQGRTQGYNAFELGASGSCDGVTTDIIYYRIPSQRFRELRDYQTNLDALVEAVQGERAERKVPQ